MKFAIVILAAFALLLAGCAGNSQPAPAPQNNTTVIVPPVVVPPVIVPPVPPENNTTATTPPSITLAQLSAHNTMNDCWMAISGNVYDLSTFSNHPGGAAYVPYCGTDATAAYATKGGRGRPHSSRAEAMLPQFFRGTFAG